MGPGAVSILFVDELLARKPLIQLLKLILRDTARLAQCNTNSRPTTFDTLSICDNRRPNTFNAFSVCKSPGRVIVMYGAVQPGASQGLGSHH